MKMIKRMVFEGEYLEGLVSYLWDRGIQLYNFTGDEETGWVPEEREVEGITIAKSGTKTGMR
jgi:hypothetical protein